MLQHLLEDILGPPPSYVPNVVFIDRSTQTSSVSTVQLIQVKESSNQRSLDENLLDLDDQPENLLGDWANHKRPASCQMGALANRKPVYKERDIQTRPEQQRSGDLDWTNQQPSHFQEPPNQKSDNMNIANQERPRDLTNPKTILADSVNHNQLGNQTNNETAQRQKYSANQKAFHVNSANGKRPTSHKTVGVALKERLEGVRTRKAVSQLDRRRKAREIWSVLRTRLVR